MEQPAASLLSRPATRGLAVCETELLCLPFLCPTAAPPQFYVSGEISPCVSAVWLGENVWGEQ